MKQLLSYSLILFCLIGHAQISMKKNIGPYFLHNDQDTITQGIDIPNGEKEPGPLVGKNVDFFKLYNTNNDSLDIALELSKGKAIFLIGGSYTCPHYRHQISFFDSLATVYKNQISFFIIYTIEAHPHYPDFSPFTNELLVHPGNLSEGIIYRQPKTYIQRKILAQEMISKTNLKLPVFIDSPSNQWLNTFGGMPNAAYLINSDGKIFSKYLDYGKRREEIKRDLISILQKKTKKP